MWLGRTDARDTRRIDSGRTAPGFVAVVATNFPMWLKGDRREPTITYEVLGTDPLVLSDVVAYRALDGSHKSIVGSDRWRHGGFKWRGAGRWRPFVSHWAVTGASEDGTVLALHFSRSLVTPAGIDILVRDGSDWPEVRAMIARATDD